MGPRIAHPDDAWKENFVISDLPAGGYFLVANIRKSATETDTVTGEVNVIAGQTNYVIMQASAGVVGNSALDIVQPPAFLPTYTPSYTPTPTNTPTPTAHPHPTAHPDCHRHPPAVLYGHAAQIIEKLTCYTCQAANLPAPRNFFSKTHT